MAIYKSKFTGEEIDSGISIARTLIYLQEGEPIPEQYRNNLWQYNLYWGGLVYRCHKEESPELCFLTFDERDMTFKTIYVDMADWSWSKDGSYSAFKLKEHSLRITGQLIPTSGAPISNIDESLTFYSNKDYIETSDLYYILRGMYGHGYSITGAGGGKYNIFLTPTRFEFDSVHCFVEFGSFIPVEAYSSRHRTIISVPYPGSASLSIVVNKPTTIQNGSLVNTNMVGSAASVNITIVNQ